MNVSELVFLRKLTSYKHSLFFCSILLLVKLSKCIELLKSYFEYLWQSDVNTVCFADETGHLIYSGSDDCLCKVMFNPFLVENLVRPPYIKSDSFDFIQLIPS